MIPPSCDRFVAVFEVQLGVDVRDVVLDCLFFDVERLGDLPVGFAG
jgi:hypothetical protein